MSRKWLVVAAVAVVAAGACKKSTGASAHDEVVAKVGNRPITKSYYEERLVKMDRRFLPDTLDLAGKKKFLDFIVNKELMAMKAEELQYDKDPRITTAMSSYRDGLAEKAALDQLTQGKIDASEQEIQDFYTKKHTKILTKHILSKTKREAEEMKKKVDAGANFDSLAGQFSAVPRQDANTGEELPLLQRVMFGEVQYGEAIIPVEEAVFSTPIDGVSGPVQTGYGWHLFKPVSTSEVKLSPMDPDMRQRIATQIQLRKKRTLTEEYWGKICDKHGFSVDDETLAMVYDKLPQDVNPEQRPNPEEEVKPIIAFSAEERAKPFIKLDGQTYTVGDFSDKYDGTNWFERPKQVTGALGVKYWIRDRWMKPLYLEQAKKDGAYDLPQVTNEIKMRTEQMMVGMLHENMIGSQAPTPTDQQLLEFYESHKKFYVEKEKRRVNLIYHVQERVVRRAHEEIKSGKEFVEVAVRYNENATTPQDVQTMDFSTDTPEFKEIVPSTWALQKVGDISEPFKTAQFWVMVQLANVTPERQLSYDEVKANVGEDFKNQWSEDKLNELLAEWKSKVKVSVDEDALSRTEVKRDDVFVPGRPASTQASS